MTQELVDLTDANSGLLEDMNALKLKLETSNSLRLAN